MLTITGVAAASAQRQRACPELMPGSVDPATLRRMDRGINLAGWMDRPTSPHPDVAVLRALRQHGFSHVRLPVPAELVMSRFTSDVAISVQLARLQQAIAELTAMGFAVSVDLHPGASFAQLHRIDARSAMEAARDAWRNLAAIIKPFPTGLVFAELLNEPDVDPDVWQSDVAELAAFVRSLLPDTTLIVGPTNWQRADSLPRLRPLADLNVVYAIHVYDPMIFTHQGHWDPEEPLHHVRGLPYPVTGSSRNVQAVRRHLAHVAPMALRDLDAAIAATSHGDLVANSLKPAAEWQRTFRRPIIVNEFGVLKAEAPAESRARWLEAVVRNARGFCWGWAHWELEQGFGLVDGKTGRLDPGMMKALTGGP